MDEQIKEKFTSTHLSNFANLDDEFSKNINNLPNIKHKLANENAQFNFITTDAYNEHE